MNAFHISGSTTRVVDGVAIEYTLTNRPWLNKRADITSADEAVALQRAFDTLPGEPLPVFGEPGGNVQFNKLTPPDIAPPSAGAPADVVEFARGLESATPAAV